MAEIELSEFLGAVLVALSEAQRISDAYSEQLREPYARYGGLIAAPTTSFKSVDIALKIAFAAQTASQTETTKRKVVVKGGPALMVYVDAGDLEKIPDRAISTLQLRLEVEDSEVNELPHTES